MGLEYHYFYSLTPRVFSNISDGYAQRVEAEMQTSWIQTRKMMYAFLRPHLKNRNATEQDLFLFPWENDPKQDDEDDIEIETAEQAEQFRLQQVEFWENLDKKRKNKK